MRLMVETVDLDMAPKMHVLYGPKHIIRNRKKHPRQNVPIAMLKLDAKNDPRYRIREELDR